MNGYSPIAIDESLGEWLAVTTVRGGGSTAVVRHPPLSGSSRATVFLHGAAGSWTTWTPMLRVAASVGSPVFEPVLFDLPGWGEAVLGRDSPATVETICDLVVQALDELGYSDWDLVGHSMGGFIALHLAATRPDAVRSVALVSPTVYSVIESVDGTARGPARIPAFVGLMRAMRILAPVDRPVRAFVRFLGRTGVLRVFAAPLLRHPFRIDRSVVVALGRELRPRAFVAATEVARGYHAEIWSTITCAVTAMKGDRDAFVSDYDFDRLAHTIPQLQATVIADCAHFGNLERPAETLAALRLIPE